MQRIRTFLSYLFALACIILLVWAFNAIRSCTSQDVSFLMPHFGFGKEEKNVPTPTQIRSIERIGQWEFLSVEDEELVDTVRSRLMLPDQRLARIYKGTLRIGIDLEQAKQPWVEMVGDTVVVTLPPIKLLNPQFIDEASTRTFYETGTWSAEAREQMFRKAHNAMMLRCLSEENLRQARKIGKARMADVFHTLGYPYVEVR